jgi:hypothetical protein
MKLKNMKKSDRRRVEHKQRVTKNTNARDPPRLSQRKRAEDSRQFMKMALQIA